MKWCQYIYTPISSSSGPGASLAIDTDVPPPLIAEALGLLEESYHPEMSTFDMLDPRDNEEYDKPKDHDVAKAFSRILKLERNLAKVVQQNNALKDGLKAKYQSYNDAINWVGRLEGTALANAAFVVGLRL